MRGFRPFFSLLSFIGEFTMFDTDYRNTIDSLDSIDSIDSMETGGQSVTACYVPD